MVLMWTNEEIKEKLNGKIELLNQHEKWLNEEKDQLRKIFFQNYRDWSIYEDTEKKVTSDEKGFKELIVLDLKYINEQKVFIEEILSLDILQENKFSSQIKSLICECLIDMEGQFDLQLDDNFLFGMIYRIDFANEYKSILILSKFLEVETDVVLIGGNGSGKSSLANAIKGNDTQNISVIPAQKTLYFSMNDKAMLSTRKSDLVETLLENNIDKSKTKSDYGYFEFQNNQFTKLIVAMKEQYTEYLIKCEEEKIVADASNTVYGELRELFGIIFPEISLQFKSDADEYLNCVKNGMPYHVNALSEGEKAVIYYAVSVLIAKEESIIVVDEPETYLNPSLTNLLWDLLTKARTDCQFVFITHSVDFVIGRNDATIAWIKNFKYPDKWEFEYIGDDFTLPKMLMTEILGSKKPIAFCEGDDKSSLDYAVYRAVLGDRYTVIPVGGHAAVIENCEVLLRSEWINIDVLGIVDGDQYDSEKIAALKDKSVMVLPFNEIEMLLVSDEVMQYTMSAIYPQDFKERIASFKEQFWNKVKNQKEKIALCKTTMCVNDFIAKEKIQEFDDVSSIEENLKKISMLNVQEIYNETIEKLEKIVDDKKYEDLLKICNLKKEITRGLANKELDSNYEDKAVQQIQTNEELQNVLMEKYFVFK